MEKKKNLKTNIKLLTFITAIFLLLGFYNTYNYILPNSWLASLYKVQGKVYAKEKSLGNYAINVEKMEKTTLGSENEDFYIVEYSGDEKVGWNKEEIKRIHDIPVEYLVGYTLDKGVDVEKIEEVDVEDVYKYYLARYNKGIVMLKVGIGDKYIEELYANKDRLNERDYYIAVSVVPRYTDGYRGKEVNIPQWLAEEFKVERINNYSKFSEGIGSVSVEEYVSTVELKNINIFTLGFYIVAFYCLYLIAKERKRRELESEGIWKRLEDDEKK